MGEIVALQFRDGLAQRRNLVDDLVGQLTIEVEPVQRSGGQFDGMTFCVTGTLSLPRKDIQQQISDAGGKLVGSVSAKLDVLIAGEKAGSKLAKANSLGIQVWSEDDLNSNLSKHEPSTSEKASDETTSSVEQAAQPSLRDYF